MKKLSQMQFAKKPGVNQSTISRVEVGAQKLRIKLIQKLSIFTGKSYADLLQEISDKHFVYGMPGNHAKPSKAKNSPATLEVLELEQLEYLRSRWSAEVHELKRDKIRKQLRLDKEIAKANIYKADYQFLQNKLGKAQAVLDFLHNADAPKDVISIQTDAVTRLQNRFGELIKNTNVLDDDEIQVKLLKIDMSEQDCMVRTQKLGLLEQLIKQRKRFEFTGISKKFELLPRFARLDSNIVGIVKKTA